MDAELTRLLRCPKCNKRNPARSNWDKYGTNTVHFSCTFCSFGCSKKERDWFPWLNRDKNGC